jgi:ABC-type transporter Mla subunit MlaD
VQGDVKDISAGARTLLANLNEVTGPSNRRQIAQLLQQANSLIAVESPKIDRIADQVLSVTRDADSLIQKVGPVVDQTDAAVANVNLTIDQLREPMRQDLAQLQSTMEQARSTMKSVQILLNVNDQNFS